ncbi:hypothetical protein [Sphaerotilus montanus]|uniref:hypothetical protein n=1 Tax=Sphaerotilus montanus TaxID=522889 RepID=UPI003FA2837C
MSSSRFKRITERSPESARSLELLGEYFDKAAKENRLGRLRLDPIRIMRIGKVATSVELVSLISILLSEHVLKRIVVVESPLGGAAAEYASVDEIPEYIHDRLSDTTLHVTPDKLRMIYVAERE